MYYLNKSDSHCCELKTGSTLSRTCQKRLAKRQFTAKRWQIYLELFQYRYEMARNVTQGSDVGVVVLCHLRGISARCRSALGCINKGLNVFALILEGAMD